MTEDRKQEILRLINIALEAQFSMYSWDDLINDALIDFTDEDRKWAKNNTGYEAYICE